MDNPKLQFGLRTGLTDVFAGTVCSVLTIAYSLSYAALIFSGPLEHSLSYGIAITFMSAAVGGAIVALRSSLPFAIAGPDSSISVVIAALVATVIQRLVAAGSTDLLMPTVIAIALATAITGLLMCVLGFTHAGRAIRFMPYPVIGGFLGATGWLMVTGAMQVVTDQRPTLTNLGAFADAALAAKLAAGTAVAIALHILLRRSKSPFVLPGVLLGSVARDLCRPAGERRVARRRASQRLDVQSAAGGRTRPAVEARRVAQFPLDGIAVACRRRARRHVRDHLDLAAQHHRDRDRDPQRSQYRARPQSARLRQSVDRGRSAAWWSAPR